MFAHWYYGAAIKRDCDECKEFQKQLSHTRFGTNYIAPDCDTCGRKIFEDNHDCAEIWEVYVDVANQFCHDLHCADWFLDIHLEEAVDKLLILRGLAVIYQVRTDYENKKQKKELDAMEKKSHAGSPNRHISKRSGLSRVPTRGR